MTCTDEILEPLPNPRLLDYEQRTNGVEMDYGNLFHCALMETIPKVDAIYFKCSNANRKVAEDYLDNTQRINAAYSFGERAFCYELYHHLRISLDTLLKKTTDNSTLILHGELQKQLLKDMTEKCTGVLRLDKKYIPDFLLHSPGDFKNQEVVMEVKSDPKLSFRKMHVDLKKINQFISRYDYKMGVFLAVNIEEAIVLDMLISHKSVLRKTIKQQDKIHIVVSKGLDPDKKVFSRLLRDVFK